MKMLSSPAVVVIASLDTKGDEADYLRSCIEQYGLAVIVVNTGVLGDTPEKAEFSSEQVARAGGAMSLQQLRASNDRGYSVGIMAKGASTVVKQLLREADLCGVIGLGGSAGSRVAAEAMRSLPIGLPKLILSTMASGDTRPYVGTRDITMMHSVTDIAGLNSIFTPLLRNAAAAIAGMATAYSSGQHSLDNQRLGRPMIAITQFGVTTRCVTAIRARLEEKGYESVVFHANGSGGRAMEELIEENYFVGVLDLTTTELADELAGGVLSAGPSRLSASLLKGIPTVVVPGALDIVNLDSWETLSSHQQERITYIPAPHMTLMRTTIEECAELGRLFAEKLNVAKGPVEAIVPLQGWSDLDKVGNLFHSPCCIAAFIHSLRAYLREDIPLIESDAHINDEGFAAFASDRMDTLVRGATEKSQGYLT